MLDAMPEKRFRPQRFPLMAWWCGLAVLLAPLSAALGAILPVEVLNTTAPPGGVAQALINLYHPKPIIIGQLKFTASDPLNSAVGMGLFSSTGDVSGAAVVQGSQVLIRFVSPSGTFGTSAGPIMGISLPVSPNALPGQGTLLQMDPASSWWLDPLGNSYTQILTPGAFTVGGTVSINNVVPGGGTIAAGTVITLSGVGFHPGATVTIDNAGGMFGPTTFVSPTQLQVTATQTFRITGLRLKVLNPDGSFDYYYSYNRGVPFGHSTQPLLASSVPIFSEQTFLDAAFGPVADGLVNGTNFLAGLAVENLNSVPANVTIVVYSQTLSATGAQTFLQNGIATLAIPAGLYVLRAVSEFVPGLTPGGNYYVRVVSPLPVQILGLQGDLGAGSLAPLSSSATAPGTFPAIQ